MEIVGAVHEPPADCRQKEQPLSHLTVTAPLTQGSLKVKYRSKGYFLVSLVQKGRRKRQSFPTATRRWRTQCGGEIVFVILTITVTLVYNLGAVHEPHVVRGADFFRTGDS